MVPPLGGLNRELIPALYKYIRPELENGLRCFLVSVLADDVEKGLSLNILPIKNVGRVSLVLNRAYKLTS